jgi:signal transduction histidine kinase/CheY-like chemotaxis protein
MQGDFRLRAQRASQDEIGDLVDAFNAMVDELERRSRTLEKAEVVLRESNRAKDEFIATLAHELRNPLAPIRTGLEIMKLDPGNGPASRRARETMERQLVHMIRLIDDLLDISRITSGKIRIEPQRIRLAAAIDSALEIGRPAIEAGAHQLTVDMPDASIELEADPTRLAQAVGNLLNNAAKYTPHGGRIALRVRRENAQAVIEVEDDGVGIPREMLDQVFSMFTQVGKNLDRAQGGLGIGLSLVRSLIQLHGGTVTADSPGAGQGSTFTTRIPCLPGDAPAAAEPPSKPAAEPSAAGCRVLVVDDNADAADSLAALLEMTGHPTRTVHDSAAVLAAAEQFRPDVVLLDIGMPGMSGHEVAQLLRADPRFRDTMLIAVTGWGADADRERSRAAGFDHHLTKPVDVDAVLALLKKPAATEA